LLFCPDLSCIRRGQGLLQSDAFHLPDINTAHTVIVDKEKSWNSFIVDLIMMTREDTEQLLLNHSNHYGETGTSR
jgi:hypothetical protein